MKPQLVAGTIFLVGGSILLFLEFLFFVFTGGLTFALIIYGLLGAGTGLLLFIFQGEESKIEEINYGKK